MKLVMTLLVRNEIDILETALAYHAAQGVDFFVVTDRKSDDGSLAVLERWQAEGRLHLIREDVDYFAQGPWVTRMAREAHARFGADWVINNDTDEFWWPVRGDLKSVLAGVPDGVGVLTVQRYNFAPRPERPGPFWDTLRIRESRSLNPAGRPLPPKVIHRGAPDVEVHWGNHGVAKGVAGETRDTDAIEIFHFPMRDFAQFERKIVTGARALAENREIDWEIGHTWRRLYALQQDGRLREYWDERVVTDAAASRAFEAGTHVEDHRFAEFVRQRVAPA